MKRGLKMRSIYIYKRQLRKQIKELKKMNKRIEKQIKTYNKKGA